MPAKNLASSTLPPPKATHRFLLTVTWVAFLVRGVNLATQSLWRDEVDVIRYSSGTLRALAANLFTAGHNGPLFFVLLRPWRNLTGDSEFALRYPAALLGTLAIPLGFELARQLGFGRLSGLWLSLLLATSPYLVWYGQEAKMYALLLVLITAAFIAYLKALTGAAPPHPFRTKKWAWVWWAIFVIVTTISYYTHILSPLMLAVYGVVALLYYPYLRQHWRGWFISMALLTLPYLPLALWQSRLFLDGFQTGHPFYPLQQEFYLLLQLYSSGLIHFAPAELLTQALFSPGNLPPLWQAIITQLQKSMVLPLILFIFLYLCGLFLGTKNKTTGLTSRLALAVWTLLPPLVIYLISLRAPVFEDRYLIYLVPAFYLTVALGLTRLGQYSRWLAGICLGLILLTNLTGLWQQQRQPIKADFRAVAAYLSSQPNPPSVIMVQIPYLQYTLNYYYQTDYTLLEGPWTNDGKSEEALDAEMTKLTTGLTDLWLVTSEVEMWDKRHLTRTWLDNHAHLVDEAHFMRVDVYYYQLRSGTIENQSTGSVDE
ncbi:MAG: glycosyltransferase family 39 protein [Anaerolineae bacterium]|nr:glycosyltransferase family 39 protein [Anaerolineae bacterium]